MLLGTPSTSCAVTPLTWLWLVQPKPRSVQLCCPACVLLRFFLSRTTTRQKPAGPLTAGTMGLSLLKALWS